MELALTWSRLYHLATLLSQASLIGTAFQFRFHPVIEAMTSPSSTASEQYQRYLDACREAEPMMRAMEFGEPEDIKVLYKMDGSDAVLHSADFKVTSTIEEVLNHHSRGEAHLVAHFHMLETEGAEEVDEDIYDYRYFLDEVNQVSKVTRVAINIQLFGKSYPIHTASNALWEKVKEHFFISAGISKDYFDCFIFRVEGNDIEDKDGGYNIEALGIFDGSVVYASVRGSGGVKKTQVKRGDKMAMSKTRAVEKANAMKSIAIKEGIFQQCEVKFIEMRDDDSGEWFQKANGKMNRPQLDEFYKLTRDCEMKLNEDNIPKLAKAFVPEMMEYEAVVEKGNSLIGAMAQMFAYQYVVCFYNDGSFNHELYGLIEKREEDLEKEEQFCQKYGVDMKDWLVKPTNPMLRCHPSKFEALGGEETSTKRRVAFWKKSCWMRYGLLGLMEVWRR